MLEVLALVLWFNTINKEPAQPLTAVQIETPQDIQPALGVFAVQHTIQGNTLQGN